MIGDSKITVTHETVVAAMQMYMDAQFASGKSPVVASVGTSDYNSNKFTVDLKARVVEGETVK